MGMVRAPGIQQREAGLGIALPVAFTGGEVEHPDHMPE